MGEGTPVISRQGIPVPGNWKLVPTSEVGENVSATVLMGGGNNLTKGL